MALFLHDDVNGTGDEKKEIEREKERFFKELKDTNLAIFFICFELLR